MRQISIALSVLLILTVYQSRTVAILIGVALDDEHGDKCIQSNQYDVEEKAPTKIQRLLLRPWHAECG